MLNQYRLFDSCAFSMLERQANEAATGNNSRPHPTEAQAAAGNYKLGRARVQGLDLRIENVRGSVRSGTSADGKQWSNRMAAHYGYIAGTIGADGDGIDVFVGPLPESPAAWVINQGGAKGDFDEHKVMLGFATQEQARAAYQNSYDRNWRGLQSIVPVSISQLKWWLRFGDKSRAISPDQLPHEGESTMDQVRWNSDAEPIGMPLPRLIYDMRRNDEGGLLLDSLTMDELMTDPDIDGRLEMDAMVVEVGMLQRKMSQLLAVMKSAAGAVNPLDFTISDPVKMRGSMQIAVIFAMDDGQAVTVWFHNPDTTPGKLTPMDELVSWKWMLNKKDITIWAAPERGRDLNAREVARRVMKLTEKNTDAFKRANARAAELAAQHAALDAEIPVLENEVAKLKDQVEVARIAKADGEIAKVPALDTRTPVQRAADELAQVLREKGLGAYNDRRHEIATSLGMGANEELDLGLMVEGIVGPELMTLERARFDPFLQGQKAQARGDAAIPPDGLSDEQRTQWMAGWSDGKSDDENQVKPDEVVPPGDVVGVAVEVAAQGADEPAVEFGGEEFTGIPDTKEGIAQMREIAVASLLAMRDEWFDCPALGEKVQLRLTGINKYRKFSADPRKIKIASGIGRLIGIAKKVKQMHNYDKAHSPNIVAYHLLRAKARLAGEELAVRFVIGEDDKGMYHWDCTVHPANAVFDSAQNGEGPTEVSPSILEGGNRGCPQDRSASHEPDRLLPAEPSAEHQDGYILDDAGVVVNVRRVFNLFIEGEAEELIEPDEALTPVQVVDAAYLFAQATERFKEYIAETVSEEDYSMFSSAKAMDLAAQEQGATISWDIEDVGLLDSVDEGDGVLDKADASTKRAVVGRISRGGQEVGAATIAGDGKAMVYVGGLGGDRVAGPDGTPANRSDDPAAMVSWLLKPAPQPEPAAEVPPAAEDANVAVLRSILAGSNDASPLALTLATIEAAVNALNDSGLLVGEVEQLAQDTITYWATLDEKVNG